MAVNIKATMGVDGASKFKTELNSAKQTVKELDSELKLAESQFKATGDQETYMSDRTSALKKQLDAQETVVRLLKEQLEQAATKYGTNSDKVSRLKTELNKAKTSQNQMKTALKEAQKPLSDTATDADTLAGKVGDAATNTGTLDDNLQNVANHLDLQAVQNFANNVAGAIENAAKKAKDLAVEVWNLGTSAGTTADDWLTMSEQYGISVEDIQKWSYAGRFVDTTLENITGSMVRFRSKFGDVREAFDELTALQNRRANTSNKTEIAQLDKQIESLSEKALSLKNNFGIDIYDAQHNLKSTADLYWEMIDVIGTAYNNGNQELAEQAAMDWFGRSAANLNPLFKAGKDAFMQLGQEAEEMGYIMKEEDVAALGAFDDQNQKLQASIEMLQLSLAKELLPLLTPIAEGFTKISDSMLEWLQSEEGKQTISDLSGAIGDVFDAMSGDIPTAVQQATSYVTDFVNGFDNAESAVNRVIDAIKTLAAIWAASKLVSFGASMVSASQSIGNFFGRLFAGIGSKGTATTTGTGTATATGGNILANLFGSTGAKILGGVGAGAYTFFKPLINQFKDAGEREEAAQKVVEGDIEVAERATELGHTLAEAESYIAGNMHEWGISEEEAKAMYLKGGDGSDTPALNTTSVKVAETSDQAEKLLDAASLLQAIVEGDRSIEAIDELDPNWVKNAFPDSLMAEILRQNGSAEAWAENMDSLFDWEYVREAEVNMAQEMLDMLDEKMQKDGTTVGQNVDQNVSNGIMENAKVVEDAGQNVAIGFANGMVKGTAPVQNAARGLAATAVSTLKTSMQIASPSRVMEQLGAYTAQGFANGIDGGANVVGGAVSRMLGAVNATPIYGTTVANTGVSGVDGIVSALNGAVVVMDGETVGRLVFPYVNAEMGNTQARRYAS